MEGNVQGKPVGSEKCENKLGRDSWVLEHFLLRYLVGWL